MRHAVLLRILPVLSHDLATPITVLRMTAMVLRRKLATDAFDADFCVERLTALEQQTDALARTHKLLGGWGLGAADVARISRPSLVTGCVALLQPLLRMRGIRLEIDPALRSNGDGDTLPQSAGPAAQPRWPGASSLRYLLLASICHLQDTRPHLERIEIQPDGDDALRIVPFSRPPSAKAASRDVASADDMAGLEAAALECLANDLKRAVRCDQDGVWLQLSAA